MLVRERGHESDEKMEAQAKSYDDRAKSASHPKSKAEYATAANAFRAAIVQRKSTKKKD